MALSGGWDSSDIGAANESDGRRGVQRVTGVRELWTGDIDRSSGE